MQELTAQAKGAQRNPLPQQGRVSLAEFAILAVQLGLLALVIRQFEIESRAFLRITLLAFLGFVVHALLPLRHRLPFFLVLSLAAIGIVFGPLSGAWLVGIGLVLIGVCHLPVSVRARAALLLLLGAGLVILRMEWVQAPWPQVIWPILASMFMFRLIVYLYDLSHEKAPTSAWRTLSYFFLLPNVCFPLFPVVDYKTFRRNYYDERAYQIYQRGVAWMFRGIVQLLLYRLVYYYFTLAPTEVASPADLAQYLLSTFLLYLRISGQFHLVIGMLHLFGFNLPETNRKYLLASSFTDFWRRINIYWKDFMLKIFYYPAYFRIRHWGTNTALILSTLFVFLMTWALHSYQWFWLRGSFPITWPDAIFWGTLALLVVANTLYEQRFGRERSLRGGAWNPRRAALGVLRTLGIFSLICVLWSLWSADSISSWLSLWTNLGPMAADAKWIPTLVFMAVLLGCAVWEELPRGASGDRGGRAVAVWRSAFATAVPLLLLSLIGLYPVYSQLPPTTASVIHSVRAAGLSRADDARMERGYYEALLRVDRFNGQLWEVYMSKPVKGLDVFEGSRMLRFTGNFLQKDLIPSFADLTPYGTIRTNRWGMRDQEYEKARPARTYRIALLGASSVMGWGVGDNETFEAVVERRLNQERAGAPFQKYEILNFAVPGYQPLQQAMVLDKAFTFHPQAVFYAATGREAARAASYLAEAIRNKIDVPYEYLRETVRQAKLEPGMEETAAVRRLAPHARDMLVWLYRDIVQRCRDRGIQPVWFILPSTVASRSPQENVEVRRIAEEAGFIILDLSDAFGNQDLRTLRLADWDTHPNALAHRLMGESLYRAILRHDAVLFAPRHARDTR